MLADAALIIRAWLAADDAVADLVDTRVVTVEDPARGYPQLVIYAVTGGPDALADGLGPAGTYTVVLWAVAGRRDGHDDMPDRAAAMEVAQAVVAAADAVSRQHYRHTSGAEVVAADAPVVVPSTAPDRATARVSVTLSLRILA